MIILRGGMSFLHIVTERTDLEIISNMYSSPFILNKISNYKKKSLSFFNVKLLFPFWGLDGSLALVFITYFVSRSLDHFPTTYTFKYPKANVQKAFQLPNGD